ncbi:MAG: hypothetical protein FVQ78_09035 [Solirubrobacterales bacterium]|nr:hypothetical protein [Solirubrobacterales bacterium]
MAGSAVEGSVGNKLCRVGLLVALAVSRMPLRGAGARNAITSIIIIVAALASWPAGAQAEEGGGSVSAECASISAQRIGMQMNLHASEILVNCGVMPAGSATGRSTSSPSAPGASFAGSDINVITGTETYPHVTQAESFVWSRGSTIVVTYNDSRGSSESPRNYSGVSVSHDDGATFTRLGSSSPFTGHASNYGDPVVVYNEKLGKWFAGFLAAGGDCGGQGIGLWTSTTGDTWTVGACAHVGSGDDRESMWVDNNPASPFYGRMYISFNDFSASGALKVTHSDNGTTWSAPVTLFSSFRRNVQLTGSPGSDGAVFSVGQHENGGGVGNTGQQNHMYRSTNGGVTWTSTTMGPTFTIPGSKSCGYFPAIPPIWRQTGFGQPAVGPGGVVQYVYAAHGAGSDESDIFYVRSTDNGATWSAPLRLNTDSSGQAQWMPSLRVTPSGVVEASWYDRRNTTNGENYERFARISPDNGASWGADEALSTVLIPQPTQPDPNVVACFAGDYNYTTANANTGFDTWTDGRVSIEPAGPVQKVFFHSIALQGKAPPTATTEAATEVSQHKATLNGTVNPEGLSTTYQFEYDTTEYKKGEGPHGTSVPVPAKDIGSGTEDIEVSETIEGLEEGKTYHFRVVASNAEGTTHGEDETFTTCFSFCFSFAFGEAGSGNGQFSFPSGIAADPEGNVWVADSENNRVQEFSPSEYKYIRKFGSKGSGDGQFEFPSGSAVDPEGNVWVADSENNRVQEFSPSGEYIRQFGSKGSGNGQFEFPSGTAVDPGGNVWVVDAFNNRVQEFSPSGEYIRQFGSKGSGNGQFKTPISIAIDPEGNIWVTDTYNRRVQEFSPSGEYIRQFGSEGSGDGQFKFPSGIAIDPGGNIWVTDRWVNRVQKFSPTGQYISQFGSEGSGDGQFEFPAGIAIDTEGNVWVANRWNGRVQKFSPSGEFIRRLGSEGSGEGQFMAPSGIAISKEGNMWVTDSSNNRVQEFSPSEYKYIRQFGSKGSGNGQFEFPSGTAVDPGGNVWVVDAFNNRVQEFSPSGEYIRQFGSKGSGNGQFKTPISIAIDPEGNIWVTDTYNRRVQEFSPSGEYIRQFGSEGSGDGQFKFPSGIAIDPGGNIWVTDRWVNRVQKFSPTGQYISQFGSEGSGDGQFEFPAGIAIDTEGNVWVANRWNGRVQKFSPSGEFIRRLGSEGSGEGQFMAPSGIAISKEGNMWVTDSSNNRVQGWTR